MVAAAWIRASARTLVHGEALPEGALGAGYEGVGTDAGDARAEACLPGAGQAQGGGAVLAGFEEEVDAAVGPQLKLDFAVHAAVGFGKGAFAAEAGFELVGEVVEAAGALETGFKVGWGHGLTPGLGRRSGSSTPARA